MKEIFDGNDGAVVETIGAGEGAGSSEGNSNAPYNATDSIDYNLYKSSGRYIPNIEENEKI
mgnify:CR=1 FL=1